MTDQPTGLPPQGPPPAAPVPPPVAQPAAPAPQPAPQPAPGAPQYGYQPGAGRPGPMPGVYFAGHPARLVAWIIDGFILSLFFFAAFIVAGVITAVIASAGSDTATSLTILIVSVAMILVYLGWLPYWWSKNGQTPGMMLMHLKVVGAADGQVISFGKGVLRVIGLAISFWVLYIGVIWILVDNKRQGWHDKLADTYVIEVP
jgi:uncharacterized RDD family membrane protein YckC